MNNRELDALIAEKVFGYEKHEGFNHEPIFLHDDGIVYPAADYSTNIMDAWLVLQRMGKLKYDVHIITNGNVAQVLCVIPRRPSFIIAHQSPTKAICLAALKAVEDALQSTNGLNKCNY